MTPEAKSAAAAVLEKTTYTASGGAIFFGLTANEFAAIGGLIIAALSLLANLIITWHFKAQHLRLARERVQDDDE